MYIWPLSEELHTRLPLVHQPHHQLAGRRLGGVLRLRPLAGESHSFRIFWSVIYFQFPFPFTWSSEWKIEAHLISQTSLSHSHEVKIRYPGPEKYSAVLWKQRLIMSEATFCNYRESRNTSQGSSWTLPRPSSSSQRSWGQMTWPQTCPSPSASEGCRLADCDKEEDDLQVNTFYFYTLLQKLDEGWRKRSKEITNF